MKYIQLGIIILLGITSLHGMESPLPVLESEAQEQICTQMLAKVQTVKQADELLTASGRMIKEHETFLHSISELAFIPIALKEIRMIMLPQLVEWKKEVIRVEEEIVKSTLGSIEYLESFDQVMQESDGDMSHEANIALRNRYTQSLKTNNQRLKNRKNELQELFKKLLSIPFKKVHTRDELKAKTQELANPQKEFVYLWKYAKFIEDFLPAQQKFFGAISRIEEKLGLVPLAHPHNNCSGKETMPDEIVNYCNHRCEILKKNLRKTLSAEQLKSLIDTLSLKHYAILAGLKITITGVHDISTLPVWPSDIAPVTVAQVKELKSRYKYCIPFTLKDPLIGADGIKEAPMLYFFSRGEFTTTNLHPTETFAFSVGGKFQICQQFEDGKTSNHTLCYNPAGSYYFVDSSLSGEPKAYKIDHVVALSFPKQKSGKAVVQP